MHFFQLTFVSKTFFSSYLITTICYNFIAITDCNTADRIYSGCYSVASINRSNGYY